MRLPRRVPWAHLGELEQICSWIFTNEEDIEAKIQAVNRLSAWKAITALPHALESTLAILVVRLQDVPPPTKQPSYTSLNLRQAYASAIIRMVNGLVDPLQVGAFARSIASIAVQLGLPSWLVELRHAATHEDLPSLELLREAARESLAWLLHNYFQPTLNPSAPLPPSMPLRPVAPLLKSYKVIMKTVTRDASLRKRQQADIDTIIRDIERWIAEARVSVDLTNVLAWGVDEHSGEDGGYTRDRGALEVFCDALLDTGAIVPLARKKRYAPLEPYLPTAASIAVWSPLLNQLRDHHALFPPVFVSRAISKLLASSIPPDSEMSAVNMEVEDSPRDTTYDEYLARWVAWAIQTWEDSSGSENYLRKELFFSLSPSLVPGKSAKADKTKILTTLLQATVSGFKDLETAAELLIATVKANPVEVWNMDDLAQMNRRLEILSSYDIAMEESDQNSVAATASLENPSVAQTGGWTLLDAQSGWEPCPIGFYYHRRGVCEDVPM